MSRPTQIMPCCAANTARSTRLFSLSPDIAFELVNPAAILSRQPRSAAQILTLSSANFLNTQLGLPMYVGAPKMIASAAISRAQTSSVNSSSGTRSVAVPGTLAAPAATASACLAVCPYPEWYAIATRAPPPVGPVAAGSLTAAAPVTVAASLAAGPPVVVGLPEAAWAPRPVVVLVLMSASSRV